MLHPRINISSNPDSSTLTTIEPTQPRRFENRKNIAPFVVQPGRMGARVVPSGHAPLEYLVTGATLKVYPGLSHGMCTINQDQINEDLLGFITAPGSWTR